MKSISFLLHYIFMSLVSYVKDAVNNSRGLIGVTAPTPLPIPSRKIAYDTNLRIKGVRPSIYTDINVRGKYDAETKKMTSGIVISIDGIKEMKGATSGVMTLALPHIQRGRHGRQIITGSEERTRTKHADVHFNNWAHASAVTNDGRDFVMQEYLDLVGKEQGMHETWQGDQLDLEFHQAAVEQFCENLRYSDTQAACTPNLNPNIFIAGLPYDGNHPVYSTNPATYTQRVATAVWNSGGGSFNPLASQTWSIATIMNLRSFCIKRGILPLPIPGLPGGKGWVVSISEEDHAFLVDPFWNNRNPGAIFRVRNFNGKDIVEWRDEIGYIGPFLFVEDQRLATLLFTGTSEGAFGIQTGYMWHGDTDLRNKDNPHYRNACVVHGNGAFYRWEPIKAHYAYTKEDYEMWKGVCSKGVRGVGQIIHNQATPAAGTHEQFTSALCLTARPSYSY